MDDDLDLDAPASTALRMALERLAAAGRTAPAQGWADVENRSEAYRRQFRRSRGILAAAAVLVVLAGVAVVLAARGHGDAEPVHTTGSSASDPSSPPTTSARTTTSGSTATSEPAPTTSEPIRLAKGQGPMAAVQMLSAEVGFAIGYDGTILRTDDGGATWADQTSCDSGSYCQRTDLSYLDMVSDTVGFAGGPGASLRTTDGRHWEEYTDQRMDVVHFVSPTEGWANTSNMGSPYGPIRLLHTTDAGDHWEVVPTPTQPAAVCFSAPDDGWYASGVALYHSGDGGRRWTRAYEVVGSIESAADLNYPLTGPTGLQCTAGGTAWVAFRSGAPATGGAMPYVLLRASEGGRRVDAVLQYPNGRLEQAGVPRGPVASAAAMSLIDRTTAFFVGHNAEVGAGSGVLITVDGPGAPHQVADDGPQVQIDGVAFVDRRRGWAVGSDGGRGRIWATKDGGATWSRQR